MSEPRSEQAGTRDRRASWDGERSRLDRPKPMVSRGAGPDQTVTFEEADADADRFGQNVPVRRLQPARALKTDHLTTCTSRTGMY
jgi:hypothetical protein